MAESIINALYIVSTPIGNLADFSQRAIDVLQNVNVIAAEDTRHSGPLMQHFAINTPMISLHQHNEQHRVEQIQQRIEQGEAVALISDAGTPLISDPGYRLVSQLKQAGIKVVPIPGCCALIAGLSASGLSSERFAFEGFLPTKSSARHQVLEELKAESRTLIFYESPRRLLDSLTEMHAVFGSERKICLARELTKLHETIETKTIAELVEWVKIDSDQQRGECVLLVEGCAEQQTADQLEVERVIKALLTELPVKKAARVTASILDISKNDAYAIALKIQQEN